MKEQTFVKSAETIAALTPGQRRITRQLGSEPAFHHEDCDIKSPGVCVDVVSGERLVYGDSHLGHLFHAGPRKHGGSVTASTRRRSGSSRPTSSKNGYGECRNLCSTPDVDH